MTEPYNRLWLSNEKEKTCTHTIQWANLKNFTWSEKKSNVREPAVWFCSGPQTSRTNLWWDISEHWRPRGRSMRETSWVIEIFPVEGVVLWLYPYVGIGSALHLRRYTRYKWYISIPRREQSLDYLQYRLSSKTKAYLWIGWITLIHSYFPYLQ